MLKILILMLTVVILSGCTKNPSLLTNESATVCFDLTCFDVELANDPEERRQGLMNRESLSDDSGMLFVFEQPKPRTTFWMKNTLIPLDMLRLDTSGHVVHIEQDVQPCTAEPCPTYGPKAASIISQYVLELNAGKAEETEIALGDKAIITY